MIFKEVNCCRSCKSKLVEILALGSHKLTGIFPNPNEEILEAPVTLMKCTNTECGLVQLKESVDPNLMYGENYGYRTGLNSAEGYFAIKSDKEQIAYIYFYNTDLNWLKKYSSVTEHISYIETTCILYDEKETDKDGFPICLKTEDKLIEYDEVKDVWTLQDLKLNTYDNLLPTDKKESEGTAKKVAVVNLNTGQNDFRFLTEGANKEFFIEIVYADNKYSHLDPFVNSSWQYKVNLTINGSMVNGTHTNFPVLITEDNIPSSVWALANVNGSDIRFSDNENGSIELAREIVSWNNVTNKTEIWVKVNLTDATNKVIWMWYDYNDATDYAPSDTYGRNNVWSDYYFVHHLEESNIGTGVDISDSSPENKNGTSANMDNGNQVVGKIDGSLNFSTNEMVSLSDFYFNDSFAFTFWFKDDGTAQNFEGIMGHGNTVAQDFMVSRIGTTTNLGLYASSAGTFDISNGQIIGSTGTEFNYYAVVRSGSTWSLYKNNVRTTTFNSGLSIVDKSGDFMFGRFISGASSFYLWGNLDEMRLSKISKSSEYIKTEYGNQNSPSLFITEGTPQINADITPPAYSNFAYNSTYSNQASQVNITITDALLNPKGTYNISTNNSGVWVNVSQGNFTTTPQTLSYIITLNDTVGNLVCFKYYAGDDTGNKGVSSDNCFTLTSPADKVHYKFWNAETVKTRIFAQINESVSGVKKFIVFGDIYAYNISASGNYYINGVQGYSGTCVNTTYSGGIAISCND
jgi:hypothetical protein